MFISMTILPLLEAAGLSAFLEMVLSYIYKKEVDNKELSVVVLIILSNENEHQ